MSEAEHDFGRGVFHDGVVNAATVVSAVEQLIGKLVSHRKVKAVAASFIEVFGKRWRNEALEFIAIDVKRLHAVSLAALLGGGPEIREKEGGEQFGILFRDLRPLRGKAYEDDRTVFQRLAQIKRDSRLAEHGAHGLIADEALQAIHRAADLRFEVFCTESIGKHPVLTRRLVLQIGCHGVSHLLGYAVNQMLSFNE